MIYLICYDFWGEKAFFIPFSMTLQLLYDTAIFMRMFITSNVLKALAVPSS
jgi:hypothetical protein